MGLYSTSLSMDFYSSTVFRQLVWLVFAAGVVWALRWIDPHFYYDRALLLYGLLVLGLLATYLMPSVGGSRRWIMLGGFRLQPSEFGKIVVVFAIARYLTANERQLHKFHFAILPLAIAGLPAMIIIGQPDLGTSIIYMSVAFTMMFWSGVSLFYLFLIVAPIISLISGFLFYAFSIWMLVIVAVLYLSKQTMRWSSVIFVINALFGSLAPTMWNSLYPHQQRRILTFLDAGSDPHVAGYQVLQSRTAIGAGGVFGKGLGLGTQTHLRFLPVRDTDFIIAVIGEELGFLAITAVLILFGWLMLRLLDRAASTLNRFASLSIVGFATIFIVHTFVNMGMSTGLMPVTGLPLPFMSYGGSFLLTCLIMIGLSNYFLSSDA